MPGRATRSPPATTFAAEGIRFDIGADGTRGDAFRLVDAAEPAQRLTYGLMTGDSSTGGGWTWLDHATSGGADAVGLGTTVAATQHRMSVRTRRRAREHS